MELTSRTAERFIEHALQRMLEVADRLPVPAVNARPHREATNSIASLVVHCCGVVEYWLGHVALGEPTTRDRDAEFDATATPAELHELVTSTLERTQYLLRRLDAGRAHRTPGRPVLYGGDRSDAAIVLHVLEECFQHLGHAELTADVVDRAERSL
jgi:hypothetical protein